jgi:cytochrome c oxidase cbb3-type subunit I/II
MQWWYGHNAVAFFLTTPFLGLMYYFLPKAANGPSSPTSSPSSTSGRWSSSTSGPARTTCTTPRCRVGFHAGHALRVMLWMPSWGGMINGLLTLRGAWNKVAEIPSSSSSSSASPSTAWPPSRARCSIKSVNALSHYTDWTIAHVHAGRWAGSGS